VCVCVCVCALKKLKAFIEVRQFPPAMHSFNFFYGVSSLK